METEIMFASRIVAVLTLTAFTLVLTGHRTGRADPPVPADRKMKASFEALQKKLPGLVAEWAKTCDEFVEPNQVKTEIKLARFTGPTDAKLAVLVTMEFGNPFQSVILPISFYLRYFDGKWTTIRADHPSKGADAIISLLSAIDLAGDK
jgi:hypothetical protein